MEDAKGTKAMKVTELLINSRKAFTGPDKWTRGEYARNFDGEKVSEFSPEACQFCIVGMLWNQSGFLEGPEEEDVEKSSLVNEACEVISKVIGGKKSISKWQDDQETSFKDVIEVLDKSIVQSRSK